MRSLFHFLQYHNGAVLLVGLLIGFSGTALAANELLRADRQENPLQALAEPTHAEVDTTMLRERDIADIDFAMRVVSTTETESGYTVTYAYTTLAIKDGVWQEVEKMGELKVPYGSVTDTTLERYVLVQLGEVLARERQFLARAQEKAKEQYARESGRNLALLSGLAITENAAKEASEENLRDLRDAPPPLEKAESLEEGQTPPQEAVLGAQATPNATTTTATSSTQTGTTTATSSNNGAGTTTTGTSSSQQSSGSGQAQTSEQTGEGDTDGSANGAGEDTTQAEDDEDMQPETQDGNDDTSQDNSDADSEQSNETQQNTPSQQQTNTDSETESSVPDQT